VRRAEAEAEPAHGAAAKPGGVAAAAEGRAPRSDSTLTRKSSWRAQVAAAAASTRKWKPYGGRSSSIKQVSVHEVRQESGPMDFYPSRGSSILQTSLGREGDRCTGFRKRDFFTNNIFLILNFTNGGWAKILHK